MPGYGEIATRSRRSLENTGLTTEEIAAEFHATVERDRGEMRTTHSLLSGPGRHAGHKCARYELYGAKQRVIRPHGANFHLIRVVLGAQVQELKETSKIVRGKPAIAHAGHFTHPRRNLHPAECSNCRAAIRYQELHEGSHRRDANERCDHCDAASSRPGAKRAFSGTRMNVYDHATGSQRAVIGGSHASMLNSRSGNRFRSAYVPATALQ